MMGLTYKENVADTRGMPVKKMVKELKEEEIKKSCTRNSQCNTKA